MNDELRETFKRMLAGVLAYATWDPVKAGVIEPSNRPTWKELTGTCKPQKKKRKP